MNNFHIPLEAAVELQQMSEDMVVPVEGLINQAIFHWAKLHGYLEPSRIEVPAARQVALVFPDREVIVDSDHFLIGSDANCNLALEGISPLHALISVGDRVELEDLNSESGTWVQQTPITHQELTTGDEITLGEVTFHVAIRSVG